MKKIKFYLSLLLLNVSFVHGAHEIEILPPSEVIVQKKLTPKLRKAIGKCMEYVKVALGKEQDYVTYLESQKEYFNPGNPKNITWQKAWDACSLDPNVEWKERMGTKLLLLKTLPQARDRKQAYETIIQGSYETFSLMIDRATHNVDAYTTQSTIFGTLPSSSEEKVRTFFQTILNEMYVPFLKSRWSNFILEMQPVILINHEEYEGLQKERSDLARWSVMYLQRLIKTLYPFFSNDPEIQQTFTRFPVLKAYLNKKWDGDFLDVFLMDCLYSRDKLTELLEEIPPMFPHLTPEGVPDYFKEKYLAVLGKHAPDFVVEESEKLDELCKKIFAKPKKKRKKKKPANPSQPPLLDPQHDEKDVEDFENAAPPALPIEDKLPEFAPKPVQPERRTKAQKKEDKRIRDQAKIVLQQSTIQAKQTVEDRYEQHHPHIKADHIFDALDQSEKTMMRDIFNHNASPNLNYAKIKTALHHMGITIEEKRGNGDFRKWKLPNGAKVFSFEPPVSQIGHHFLDILRKGLGEKWGVTKEHFEG